MKKIVCLLLLCFLCPLPLFTSEDIFWWPEIQWTMYKDKNIHFYTLAQARLGDGMKNPKIYLVSERLHFHQVDNLDVGVHYTFLRVKHEFLKVFHTHHRFELEINPWFHLCNDWTVHVRNRIEWRWIENEKSTHNRFRNRWQLTIPLNNSKYFESIQASNEFFYDFKRKEYTENRLIPLSLTLKHSKQHKFKIYYLLQTQKIRNWRANHVLGTDVYF